MSAHTREIAVDEDPEMQELLSTLLLDAPNDFDTAMTRAASLRRPRPLLRPAPEPKLPDLLVIDMTPARGGEVGRFRVMRPRPELSALILDAVDADDVRGDSGELEAYAKLAQTLRARALFDRILELREGAVAPAVAPHAVDDSSRGRYASFAGWRLDLARHELESMAAGDVHLPETEFALLLAFLDHPRQVMSREQLVDDTRGTRGHVSVRTLDVYVSRLRRKLRADTASGELISTRRSAGYIFNADPRFE